MTYEIALTKTEEPDRWRCIMGQVAAFGGVRG